MVNKSTGFTDQPVALTSIPWGSGGRGRRHSHRSAAKVTSKPVLQRRIATCS